MKKFLKLISSVLASIVLFGCLSFYGCSLIWDGNDILSVRRGADLLRGDMTKSLGEGFIARNTDAVKELFCGKSRELPEIEEQIETTFAFIEGNVVSYEMGERGYESYGAEKGSVTDYEFDSKIFLSADSGKTYLLTFRVQYVAEDPIRGMTAYTVEELYVPDFDYRRAGYYWASPYDAECGILSAALIRHLELGNVEEIKRFMCPLIRQNPETDGQIQAVAEAFEGNALFTERADGLYNASDADDDFTCLILACEISKDGNGNTVGVWLNVIARSIKTDAGKNYDLDFVVYLKNESEPQYEGVCYLAISDGETVSAGIYIHE